MFLVGDLSRFLRLSFYLKPAFILGAMAMCGVGVPLALMGLRRLDAVIGALLLGAVLYFVVIPTAADQTYYALPATPAVDRLDGERPVAPGGEIFYKSPHCRRRLLDSRVRCCRPLYAPA